MGVSLQKGQKVSLAKEAPGIRDFVIGLGWDANRRGGPAFDLDAFAFGLRNGRFVHRKDLCYFGNKKALEKSLRHTGDNLTGRGDGDDEQIICHLGDVPADVDRIVIGVNIFHARSRMQDFGMVRNAFVRMCDEKSGREVLRYDLTESYAGMNAMLFGEIYRRDGEWKFNALGSGVTDSDIQSIADRYA